MTGRLRPLLLGLWMTWLYWPFAHAGGYSHASLLAILPLAFAFGDLIPWWPLKGLQWVVVLYAELGLAWQRWPTWHWIGVYIGGALRQMLFLPPSQWNQISAHAAAPLLLVGGLVGWLLFRQCYGRTQTLSLLVLGTVVIALDHVLWKLPAQLAMAGFLTVGLWVLLDQQEAYLHDGARDGGLSTKRRWVIWGAAVLLPLALGWRLPAHSAADPLGIFRGQILPGFSSSGTVATTGYGPGVTQIGHSLVASHTPVFIVKTSHPSYWQAAVYSHFNGSSWSNTGSGVTYQETPNDLKIPLLAPYYSKNLATVTVHASFTAASPQGLMTALFYVGVPTHLSRAATVHTISGRFVSSGIHRYQLTAEEPRYKTGVLVSQPFATPPPALQQDLATPSNLSPKVAALAQKAAIGAKGPWQAAQDIKRYLDHHYRYSLTVTPTNQNVVNHFLLVDKKGYCDQFSSAFIMMMRSLHIPARWVVGYSSGTYSQSRHGYVVRALDAHSWAQIWMRGVGWVPFDPTPGFSAPLIITQKSAAQFNQPTHNGSTPASANPHLNSSELRRDRRLAAKNRVAVAASASNHGAPAIVKWWPLMVALLAAAGAASGVRRYRLGRTTPGIWFGMQRLSRHRLGGRTGPQSPRQWALAWLRYHPDDADIVWQLVRLLERSFYGQAAAAASDQQELRHLWAALKRRGRRRA